MRITSAEPEILMVRHWLDSWTGFGAIVVGMLRHGYAFLSPATRTAGFLHRSRVYHPWVGQVIRWSSTPWRAVLGGSLHRASRWQ
jgi:hypothetical protein